MRERSRADKREVRGHDGAMGCWGCGFHMPQCPIPPIFTGAPPSRVRASGAHSIWSSARMRRLKSGNPLRSSRLCGARGDCGKPSFTKDLLSLPSISAPVSFHRSRFPNRTRVGSPGPLALPVKELAGRPWRTCEDVRETRSRGEKGAGYADGSLASNSFRKAMSCWSCGRFVASLLASKSRTDGTRTGVPSSRMTRAVRPGTARWNCATPQRV